MLHQAKFFTFFYYSFNNLLFNSIQEIVAVMPMSQMISMIESMFALILVAIFISLILSVKSQRLTDELNQAINNLEKQGGKMDAAACHVSSGGTTAFFVFFAAAARAGSIATDFIFFSFNRILPADLRVTVRHRQILLFRLHQ